MRIYGDTDQYVRQAEKGIFYGHNDVLVGEEVRVETTTYSPIFGETRETEIFQKKLYIHIADSPWSKFTGYLRQYLLPWRWKTAYLDQEDGTPPKEILVCVDIWNNHFSNHLKSLLGKSLCVADLISRHIYEEIFGQEYLLVPGVERHTTKIIHPLGELIGSSLKFGDTDNYYRIVTEQGMFSKLESLFLKTFSKEWEEVRLLGGNYLQTALVRKVDLAILRNAHLIDRNEEPAPQPL